MKDKFNCFYIVGGLTLWLTLFTAGSARAQNFSEVVSQPDLSANAPAEESAGSYADVSLIYQEPGAQAGVDSGEDVVIPEYILESTQYTLGKEDVIDISVLRHPEVSGQFIINNDGKIQYNFIGDINIEGLKKDEVKTLLVEKLSEYIISPDVTVMITGYKSKIVYVVGEVGSPGKIYMRGDTITVREALVQAGLPLLSGKTTVSKLITPSETGKVEKKTVNVHKLLYEGDLRENLVMKPGDTLYIPPTFMAKAMRTIQPVTQPINAAGSTGRRIYTGGF